MQLTSSVRISIGLLALVLWSAGCGTTKWSDSPRTATEQLLISDAVDRAVSEIDFTPLADKHVYLDTRFIITAIDQNYVISTLRQHMLASGCIIHDKPDDATYIVEVRTGSVGTNRQDLLFGMPSTTVPTVGLLPTGSATIPEIALMKRTNQQGVCKLAVFAYARMSGRPVWQSGNRQVASRAKDIWVMGAGPFQRGTIYGGTAFAGERFNVPLVNNEPRQDDEDRTTLEQEKVFHPDGSQVAKQEDGSGVNNASYNGPMPKGDAAAGRRAGSRKATPNRPTPNRPTPLRRRPLTRRRHRQPWRRRHPRRRGSVRRATWSHSRRAADRQSGSRRPPAPSRPTIWPATCGTRKNSRRRPRLNWRRRGCSRCLAVREAQPATRTRVHVRSSSRSRAALRLAGRECESPACRRASLRSMRPTTSARQPRPNSGGSARPLPSAISSR